MKIKADVIIQEDLVKVLSQRIVDKFYKEIKPQLSLGQSGIKLSLELNVFTDEELAEYVARERGILTIYRK